MSYREVKMSEITEQSAAQEVLPQAPDTRALNAVKHGLGAEHVPPHEREAYAAHVQAVRESSGAAGYLQERLADRAALALWRLERVARYEAAQSSKGRRDMAQTIHDELPYGGAEAVSAAYGRLSDLVGETPAVLRSDPLTAEQSAQEYEAGGAYLEQIAAGGEAQG